MKISYSPKPQSNMPVIPFLNDVSFSLSRQRLKFEQILFNVHTWNVLNALDKIWIRIPFGSSVALVSRETQSIADWSWLSLVFQPCFPCLADSAKERRERGSETVGEEPRSRCRQEKTRQEARNERNRGTNPRGHTYENAILASGVEFQRDCSHDKTNDSSAEPSPMNPRLDSTRLDSSHCHSLNTLINQRATHQGVSLLSEGVEEIS